MLWIGSEKDTSIDSLDASWLLFVKYFDGTSLPANF